MRKHVLITGGTGGIGQALVRSFANAGYKVSFAFNSSFDKAKILSEETGAEPFAVNFENTDHVIEFAERLVKESGGVDVLVNNAGVAHYGLIQDVSPDDFRSLFSINFESAFFLTRALIPSMVTKKSGCVINISSVWGQTGGSCEVLYSSTKGALISFTKALAKELAPSGVAVNCISPGVVDTDMMKRFSEDEKKILSEEIPAGRFVDADEIAALALFLSNNASVSLTGQIFGINGGMYC